MDFALRGVEMTSDPVHHPDHYTWIPGHETKDVTAHFDFFRGSAIKYIWRSGRKANTSEQQDIEKAIECLRDRLAFIKSIS